MSAQFGLKLGLFAPSVREQLAAQNLQAIDAADADHWQKDREAIKRLEMRDVLTMSAAGQARQRLMRQIGKSVEPVEQP
jgi:hypothetical protein